MTMDGWMDDRHGWMDRWLDGWMDRIEIGNDSRRIPADQEHPAKGTRPPGWGVTDR